MLWSPETAYQAIVAEIKRLASQPTYEGSYQPVFQTPNFPAGSDISHAGKSDENVNTNEDYALSCSLL